jgi:hypothetical protein
MKKDRNNMQMFGRRILGMIYSAVNDNGVWRTGYSNELYTHCDELDLAWSK